MPTPTRPSTGVRVYHLSSYQGISLVFGGDEQNLEHVLGPCDGNWDDCISSIRVPEGWQAVLYEHPDFDGRSLTLASDMDDLSRENFNGWSGCDGDWDDCASSIRVSQQ